MNVFTIATNDQSIYYLGRIFGQVGTVLPGTGPIILSVMFKVFNTAILGIGALVVTYTTVVGILNTAAEGEFLGKHWHSIWVPLRTVIGIAGLFPMKSGYCAMQVLIMWVILQGVGAADSVWNAAINYFRGGGSITVPSPVTALANTGASSNNFTTIWQGLVCEAAARKYLCGKTGMLLGDPGCTANSIASRISCSNAGACTVTFGPHVFGEGSKTPICGSLSWDTSQPGGQGQDQVFRSILPTFAQIADFLVTAITQEKAYISAVNSSGGTSCAGGGTATPAQGYPPATGSPPNCAVSCDQNCLWNNVVLPYAGSNFLADAANAYQGYINNAMTQSTPSAAPGKVIGSYTPGSALATALGGGIGVDLNKTYDIARDNGWIFAGGYFYFIASMTNKNINSAAQSATINVAGPDIDGVNKKYNFIYGTTGSSPITDMVNAAGSIAGQVQKQQSDAGGSGKMGGAANVTTGNAFTDTLVGIFSLSLAPAITGMFMAMVGDVGAQSGYTSQQNPVVTLQAFGETLLIITQILFFVVGVGIFTGTMISAIGSCMNPTGYAFSNISIYVLPALFFLFLALFTFGATLAVYVPLIPYIIYTMGAIGWMISTIEAMVAAPIVALGIMHPEGQHQIWGKAEHGVLLLMNIFLRPTLMVFGLIAGMLMSYVVVTLINAAFLNVMRQIYSGPGIVELILFLAAYCGLVITALNKCFSLIHLLPERVLGWIGGRGEAFGEGEAAKEVGGKVSGAAGALPETGQKAGEASRKRAKMRDAGQPGAKVSAEGSPETGTMSEGEIPKGRGRSGGQSE